MPRRTPALIALTVAIGALAVAPTNRASAAGSGACPWLDARQAPAARAHRLVSAMTVDDKIQMVTGIGILNPTGPNPSASGTILGNPRLCIPDLVLNDSSGGIGFQQQNTTAFPQGITQASTWNRSLIAGYGTVLADEAIRKGVNVVLGPGLNLARTPLNGRTLEYAGEDPYLTGQLGAQLIRGIQRRPVIADAKHYLLNEQETYRMTGSSEVDERTLREIYLAPFVDAIRAGVGSVMCSYNRVASTYACEHRRLLQQLLKDELGFDGFVMSDWGATHTTVGSANAGMDMEMSGNGYLGIEQAQPAKWGKNLKAAVTAGTVPRARLDDMVRRILTSMFRFGLFEHPPVTGSAAANATATTSASRAMARQIAVEGSVLLKNRASLLPLTRSSKKVAVIGIPATRTGSKLASQGFGSNHVPVFGLDPNVISPLSAIRARAKRNGTTVTYAPGTVRRAAATIARRADAAIVFVNDANVEGVDRKDLNAHQAACNPFLNAISPDAQCLPIPVDQEALVAAVAAANPRTVVVLQNGAPLAMPWLGAVGSVVENWYPGEIDGQAVADLLFGDANFSGKLPITFPRKVSDGPLRTPQQYPGVSDAQGVPHTTYSERLRIGYRWFDQKKIKPLFPFGYGLSYTSFKLSRLKVRPTRTGGAAVRVRVTNTGRRAGAETVQVYLGFPKAAGEPPRQLKGFQKVSLAPGASKTVSISLDKRAFSIWAGRWTVKRGCYRVHVGDSSAHLPLVKRLARAGGRC